jgi:protein N-terminal methyltransferase
MNPVINTIIAFILINPIFFHLINVLNLSDLNSTSEQNTNQLQPSNQSIASATTAISMSSSTTETTPSSTPDSNINHASSLEYWNNIPPTVNGMLGGFPQVSRIDLRGSASFLAKIRRLIQVEQSQDTTSLGEAGQSEQRKTKKLKRGVDCGAGIGRVTQGFLRNVCETVDVVEPVAKFAEVIQQGPLVRKKKITTATTTTTTKTDDNADNDTEAPEKEEEEEGVIENIYITGLETWLPEHKYDLIWNQWCVGHLTDAQLTAYLQRAADALTSNGIMVLKENNSTDLEGKDIYDEVDSSVTRTDETFRRIFKKAGLNLIKAEEQLGFPRHLGLLPVRTYALRPVRSS